MRFTPVTIFILLICLFTPGRGIAQGATTVGDGTPASCTPVALANAVAVGGAIDFACGPAPITIITDEMVIATGQDVSMEGGDLVTLSGGDANRIFRVAAGATLLLRNLVLVDGAVIGSGGAIYNEGALILDHVILRNNQADGDPVAFEGSGGAVVSFGGEVTVISSIFSGNRALADGGGAIMTYFAADGSIPTVLISGSHFEGNWAGNNLGGAVALVGGTGVIENSAIISNTALTGGGLFFDHGGDFTLRDTIVADNHASTEWGGGIMVANNGSPDAISKILIQRSTITSNTSQTEGGGIYLWGGQLVIEQSTITSNTSQTEGGGIYLLGGYYLTDTLTVIDSLLADNHAANAGGAVWTGSADSLEFANVTFSRNRAGAAGGAIFTTGDVALTHATLADNQAPAGASLYLSPTVTLTLAGSSMTTPVEGVHCVLAGGAVIQSGGANVVSDASCALVGVGDLPMTDPMLGPLADNGGPTLTHLPLLGSPAIDHTPLAICPAHDQRGYIRPAGAACDSGAVEVDAPPASPPPPPAVETVTAQDAALEELAIVNGGALELSVEEGRVRGVFFSAPIPPAVGSDPVVQATWVLTAYNVFGLPDPLVDLQFAGRSADNQHLFFDQVHAGLPVFPGGVAVHLDGDAAIGVTGGVAPVFALAPVPRLSQADAEQHALTHAEAGLEVIGDTQLLYIDLSLLGVSDGGVYLAWQVNLGVGQAAEERVFVEASSGATIFRLPRAATDLDLDLEDGNFNTVKQLCSIFEDDDIGCNDQLDDSSDACRHVSTVYNFWRNALGRDSYDGDGEQIELNISVNMEEKAPNASYGNCDLFIFSPGMVKLDIVGHEFTHAVDQSARQLIYANQSGALDESFADIFGYFVDPGNWLHGEGAPNARSPQVPVRGSKVCSPTQAGRDLSNPPCFGDPDHVNGAISGDGVGLRPATKMPSDANDKGGVHTNSGIHNKVAYLLIQGGSHNGYDVQPLGAVRARRLFYYVLTNWLTSNATLREARDAAIGEAKIQQRRGELSLANVCAVRRAYAAVGIGFPDLNCDGIDDNSQPDPDEDGVPSSRDNCPIAWNPGQENQDSDLGDLLGDVCDPDRDGDGWPNESDNCPVNRNPGQADWNRDKEGDVCDDTDGDFVNDDKDNCRLVRNPLQENQDSDLGDLLGDACDPDRDGDGWPNESDNCPVNRNPGQEDTTEIVVGLPRDGLGDACDLCPLISSPDNTNLDPEQDQLANPCDDDDDGDGVLDAIDNCPLLRNPDQFDWNENGRGFVCDPNEQNGFGDYLREQLSGRVILSEAARIPIPICADCPVAQLPPNFDSVLTVMIPSDYRTVVVDKSGDVIAKPQLSGVIQTLKFTPAPRSFVRGFGTVRASDSDRTSEQYYLQFMVAPGIETSQPVDVVIQLVEGAGVGDTSSRLFIPIIVR
jgi:predicted outer membrane repeat protein